MNFCGRTAAWKRLKRLVDRSAERVEKDLDVISMIKTIRNNHVSIRALMSKNDRKFV